MSEADDWVRVLRAVSVMIQRYEGVGTSVLPIPERPTRVELTIECDAAVLRRTIAKLDRLFGFPQREGFPPPLAQMLTSDQRLQAQYRAAGETH